LAEISLGGIHNTEGINVSVSHESVLNPAIIQASELGIDPEALWQTADKLRGSIDAAEYKHVVLGLIFLKYAI
jgi:hypothetical protein